MQPATMHADDDADTDDDLADNVGKPVTATDADDDTPTYTLGGNDKDMFRLRANGQIEVGAKAMLDYEKKKRYTVTVIADDGYGESNSTASITVTIHVTDLDEGPAIKDKLDSTAEGQQHVEDYAEECTDDPVLRLSARDPEGVTPIVWSLLTNAEGHTGLGHRPRSQMKPDDVMPGDVVDHADFEISQDGVLTFASQPRLRGARRAVLTKIMAAPTTYKRSRSGLRRRADGPAQLVQGDRHRHKRGGAWEGNLDCRCRRRNVPAAETAPGLTQFRAGASLTATVTDDDGAVSNERWQWYRSSSKSMAMGTADRWRGLEATYTTTDSPDSRRRQHVHSRGGDLQRW